MTGRTLADTGFRTSLPTWWILPNSCTFAQKKTSQPVHTGHARFRFTCKSTDAACVLSEHSHSKIFPFCTCLFFCCSVFCINRTQSTEKQHNTCFLSLPWGFSDWFLHIFWRARDSCPPKRRAHGFFQKRNGKSSLEDFVVPAKISPTHILESESNFVRTWTTWKEFIFTGGFNSAGTRRLFVMNTRLSFFLVLRYRILSRTGQVHRNSACLILTKSAKVLATRIADTKLVGHIRLYSHNK